MLAGRIGGRDGIGGWQQSHTILVLCISAYFAVRFSQILIGPVIPLIIEEFAVSRGTIGAGLTGMWIVYGLLQLPSGVVADHVGERHVIVSALVICAVATIGLALAPTFLVFGVAIIGLGIGAGAYYNPATTFLTREFTEIGGPIGTHRIGGQIAGVAAPVFAATVSVRFGWRSTMAVGGVLAVAVAGWFLWKTNPKASSPSSESLSELLDLGIVRGFLARPHTRNTTVMMTLLEFVELAAMAFLPTFLVQYSGFTIARANLLFAVFFAASALSQPLGGWLSDQIGRDSTIAMQTIAGIIGYVVLITTPAFFVVVPAVVLAGASMSGTPVLQSRMLDGLADGNRGSGFGLFRTSYMLLGAAGTVIVGTTADYAGWSVAFGLLAGLLGILLGIVLIEMVRQRELPSNFLP